MVQLAICSLFWVISFKTDLQTANYWLTLSISFLLALSSSLVCLLNLDRLEQQFLSASANSAQKQDRSLTALVMQALKVDCISRLAFLMSSSCISAMPTSRRLSSVLFLRLSAYSRSTMRLLNLRLVQQHTFEIFMTANPLPLFTALLPIIYTLSLKVTWFLFRSVKFVLLFSSLNPEFFCRIAEELTDRCLLSSKVRYWRPPQLDSDRASPGRPDKGAWRLSEKEPPCLRWYVDAD